MRMKKWLTYIPGITTAGYHISVNGIEKVVAEFLKNGKKYCLDIGSDKYPSEEYQQVDFREGFEHLDYKGDIRCCFAPGYMNHLDEFPDLERLMAMKGHFKLIKMTHVIEHIEWIHQETLFIFVRGLLCDGGLLYIATPNLEYAARLYVRALEKVRKGKEAPSAFPFGDHTYLSAKRDVDVTRWFNSQVMAGCSLDKFSEGCTRGDYHHSAYDGMWLYRMLADSSMAGGFTNVRMYEEKHILAIAQKPYAPAMGLDEALGRVLS